MLQCGAEQSSQVIQSHSVLNLSEHVILCNARGP